MSELGERPPRPNDMSPSYSLFAERAWAYMLHIESELEARDREIAELRDEVKEYAFLFELQKGRLDEATAEAEKLAEALELYAYKRNWRRAYDGQGHLNVFQADTNGPYTALDALDAYRNRPQVSQDANTYIKEQPIRDTILQEKDTHFACKEDV